jgi:thiosulfate reductase cytochrome b subunit
MNEVTAAVRSADSGAREAGHRRWVRLTHWVVVLSFLTLAVSGILILMVHPRLYWGEVGNDLTPALLEIPISNNHQPEGWEKTVSFSGDSGGPISADRTYPIFNQNGWARSLHFLAAWFLVLTGLVYVLAGLVSGHLWRNLLPRIHEMAPGRLWRDFKVHLRAQRANTRSGPPYGLLQKLAYTGVVLVLLPLMLLTGLTMAPAITVAFPGLLDLFGGYQSARTIHFFTFAMLLLFLFAHVVLVIATGARRQLRAMILG